MYEDGTYYTCIYEVAHDISKFCVMLNLKKCNKINNHKIINDNKLYKIKENEFVLPSKHLLHIER